MLRFEALVDGAAYEEVVVLVDAAAVPLLSEADDEAVVDVGDDAVATYDPPLRRVVCLLHPQAASCWKAVESGSNYKPFECYLPSCFELHDSSVS